MTEAKFESDAARLFQWLSFYMCLNPHVMILCFYCKTVITIAMIYVISIRINIFIKPLLQVIRFNHLAQG